MSDSTRSHGQAVHWGVRLAACLGAALCFLTLLAGIWNLQDAVLVPKGDIALAAGVAIIFAPFTIAGLLLSSIAGRKIKRPLRSSNTGKVVLFTIFAGVAAIATSVAATLVEHSAPPGAYAALASVRMIVNANSTYQSKYPTLGFAKELKNLGGTSPCTESSERACLLDPTLTSGHNRGYLFTYVAEADAHGMVNRFWVRADPDAGLARRGAKISFFTDQTGVIRFEKRKQATSSSPEIDQEKLDRPW